MNNFTYKQKLWLGQKNCIKDCKKCWLCKSTRSPYDTCWSACEKCNFCNMHRKRSNLWDQPYVYSHPDAPLARSELPVGKRFCENICGYNMCKGYRDRFDNYKQCQRCQLQNKCWSEYQRRCVECEPHQYQKSCEEKMGCRSPFGKEFGFVPPIDPMFTECVPCWDEGKYTTF